MEWTEPSRTSVLTCQHEICASRLRVAVCRRQKGFDQVCGIAGALDLTQRHRITGDELSLMAGTMRHRGPDDSGVWVSETRQIGLSHRRLAILDLSSAGHQPMANADGSVQVVFNGEIYNFKELREGLSAKGYHFRSTGDTEVLVHLYTEVGDRIVDYLDGDFSFAAWDARRSRLFLARDRAGFHPIYYTVADGRFLFASEIKALLRHPAVSRDVDEQAFHDYLTFLVVPPPRTMFRGISKLPAATTMTVDGRGVVSEPQKFWLPIGERRQAGAGDLDVELSGLLRRAVRKRLLSDVPVGVLFSGGVDSALNAALFREAIGTGEMRTFHVATRDAPGFRSEESVATDLAHHFGAEHHVVPMGQGDLRDAVSRLAALQDEPLADPVAVPLFFVTRLARESGTIVLQAGEGADEIFCGYDSYRRYLRLLRSWWPALRYCPGPLQRLIGSVLQRSGRQLHTKVADIVRRAEQGQELFLSAAVAFYELEKRTVLSRDMLDAGRDSFDVIRPLYRQLEEGGYELSHLRQLQFIELQLRLPELLLMRLDKMAMANSVEVRSPFLDSDVVDFALSAPDSYLLRDGISKEPLKRLLAGFVGEDVAYRPKMGFGVPIHDWFMQGLGEDMRELIADVGSDLVPFIDISNIEARLSAPVRRSNEAFQLWVLFNFMLWYREFFKENSAGSRS